MSLNPPPGQFRPAQPRARVAVARAAVAKMPPWGWLEWFVVLQTFIPAVLFVPGMARLRVFTRIASYLIAVVAWASLWYSRKKQPGGRPFRPLPWLTGCIVWLCLSLMHPDTNTLLAGIAQVAMYITVMSPAFWAPSALTSSRQLPRLIMIMFACNALSAFVGFGQAHRPAIFNPPYIPAIDAGNEISRGSLTYETADGRTIIRPCGLTDNPGAAGAPGVITCLIGLCVALRPIALWKRLGGLGLAFIGMAVIYYCQARVSMVMVVFCLMGMIGLFLARRNYHQAALLGIGSCLLVVGAAAWVVSSIGSVGVERFLTLVQVRPDELYQKSRGTFVQETFASLIWNSPLGGGLGRYGQANEYFGDRTILPTASNGQTWVEVQWPGWVIDGGIPLMLGYVVAIALALLDSVRIALRTQDRELAFWAAVICALNVSIAALCFSQCPFIAPVGLTFWLLAGALHAADKRTRPAPAPGARPPAGRVGPRPA